VLGGVPVRLTVDEKVDLADVLDLEARVRIDHVTGSAVRLDGGGRLGVESGWLLS
jgi:hypothetical protein